MRAAIVFGGVEYRCFDHLYAVSRSGQLLKIRTLSIAEPRLRPDGYQEIGRRRLVHRVVATCWVPRPDGANHVHHKNRVRSDNRAINLEWVTPKAHLAERHRGEFGHYERSEATRQKLREYRTGRKTSAETKRKQREANLRLGIRPPRPIPGYKHSESALANMRLNSPNAVGCEIAGVAYRSFSEAGRALGMKPHTLRRRCLSSSFSDHRMLKDE